MTEHSKIYINRNDSDRWKEDTHRSVEMYNEWFLGFAPSTYICERERATRRVADAMKQTDNFRINADCLYSHPGTISVLRMATAPPIARERLAGLSGVRKSAIGRMEEDRLPVRMTEEAIKSDCSKIANVLSRLFDTTLCPWIETGAILRPVNVVSLPVSLPTVCVA